MDEKNVSSTEPKKIFTTPYILKGEFFEILKQEGEAVTVQCKKCPQKNIYKGSVKSTGNFHMHIKRKHPESLERLQELKLQSFMERKIKIPDKLKNHTLLTIIQNKKLDNGDVTSDISISQTNSTTPIIQNLESSYNNQPMNYCKKRKMMCSDVYEPNTYNISPQSNQNIEITSKPKKFLPNTNSIIYDDNIRSLKEENISENSKCLNNCNLQNSLTKSGNSFQVTSSEPLLQNSGYTSIKANSTSTNNLPLTATLTAASMIMSPTQEVLGKIDNHLKSIERQLHLRNQIETNKIYLDLAKFKYLHPNFSFQG